MLYDIRGGGFQPTKGVGVTPASPPNMQGWREKKSQRLKNCLLDRPTYTTIIVVLALNIYFIGTL